MQKTIFALATGNQTSAISVIRVSGKESASILKKLTSRKTPKRSFNTKNFTFQKAIKN